MGKETKEFTKKKGLTMMKALLLTSLLPVFIMAIVLTSVGISTMTKSLEEDVYHELLVAAEGLAEFYVWDIVNMDEHMPVYEHDYVDCLLDNDIQLTLFLDNVRYITSITDSSNPTGRNEGTTVSNAIWEKVKNGESYTDKGVAINGKNYYVAYIPLEDETGKIWGMAFAGMEEAVVDKEVKSATNILIIIALVLVLICSVIVLFIAKAIKEPLMIIARNLELLSDGELKPWKTAKSRIAEIDSIIQSRKKLSNALQEIVQKVQDASSDLLQNGTELKNVAENTSTNAEDISRAVEEMSKGAISMATDIENANDKVSDMGVKIEDIVGGMDDLDNVAGTMDVAGKKAMEIIEALDHSNNKTVEAIQIVAENVEATDHSVAQISSAVNVITEIADQTNLLALNASIEAARAGDAGKGFAVVANEISSLADQSSESAKKIEEILSNLVADSKRSIQKMGEVKQHLQEQQDNLKQTQIEFANVSSGIKDTRQQSELVDGQAKDCDASRARVVDIIANLSSISEQNAASTQETTASIQELTATINLVAQQAQEVQSRAELLDEAMKFFKL